MNIQDMEMPTHVHSRIMKRVFLAGYAKYLAFSGAILTLNLSVLGFDLYRAFTTNSASIALKGLRQSFTITPSYVASAINTIYSILPLQSLIATTLTVALSTYIAVMFVKIYKNPAGLKLLRNVA